MSIKSWKYEINKNKQRRKQIATVGRKRKNREKKKFAAITSHHNRSPPCAYKNTIIKKIIVTPFNGEKKKRKVIGHHASSVRYARRTAWLYTHMEIWIFTIPTYQHLVRIIIFVDPWCQLLLLLVLQPNNYSRHSCSLCITYKRSSLNSGRRRFKSKITWREKKRKKGKKNAAVCVSR